jgi:hypothetical protein
MPDISVDNMKDIEATESNACDEDDNSSQDEKLSNIEIAARIRESLRGREHSDSVEILREDRAR